MKTFIQYVIESHWDSTPSKNWIDQSTGKEHIHTVEHRPINSLRAHETPNKRKVTKIINHLKSGGKVPMIQIGSDGTILDGHHRHAAAKKLHKSSDTIPVEVHTLR